MDKTEFKLDGEEYFSNDVHLSIEICDKTVSLAVLDNTTNTYFGLERFTFLDNDFLGESNLLKVLTPKTISCSINNLKFSLVPFDLFDEQELLSYHKYSFKEKNDKLFYSISNKQQVVSCYALDEKLIVYLFTKFPNIELLHFSSVLIDAVTHGVHINFSTATTFECVLIDENGLLFYNAYEYSTPEETLYYLSLVCDKHQLDVQKIKISVSGNITPEVLHLWDDYIPKNNLHYKNKVEYYTLSDSLASLPKHKYFSLLKQHTCV